VTVVLNTAHGNAANQSGVSHEYVMYASVVLEYAPEIVDSVIGGKRRLKEAYAAAQRRKKAGRERSLLQCRSENVCPL
jgi:hypothetical protein